jgi:hypothetical protein
MCWFHLETAPKKDAAGTSKKVVKIGNTALCQIPEGNNPPLERVFFLPPSMVNWKYT